MKSSRLRAKREAKKDAKKKSKKSFLFFLRQLLAIFKYLSYICPDTNRHSI